jgi:hypothetical protein
VTERLLSQVVRRLRNSSQPVSAMNSLFVRRYQPVRLAPQPVQPFEAEALHRLRRALLGAGQEVERGAYSDGERGREPGRVPPHPQLLLRHPQPTPHHVRA